MSRQRPSSTTDRKAKKRTVTGSQLGCPTTLESTFPQKLWKKTIVQEPVTRFKVVAAVDGRLVSIFDGKTEYRLGQKLLAKRGTPGQVPLDCCYFSWTTPQEAKASGFPAGSRFLDAPRALISLKASGYTYVDKKEPHKLAHEEVYIERVVAIRIANVWQMV